MNPLEQVVSTVANTIMDTKNLIIAVSATSNSPKAKTSDRFARCDCFALYRHENNSYEFIDNIAKEESGGAGAKAAKFLGDHDVNVVLVPEVGPKAYDALHAFDIAVYRYNLNDTVIDAIHEFYANKLPQLTTATKHGEHH